jgi:hypothetical protein
MTTIQNETLWQGKSETIVVSLTASDGSTPIALDDSTLRWELWHLLTGVALEKTTDKGIIISDTYGSHAEISVSAPDTATLIPLTYWQGLFYIPAIGDGDMIMQGFVTVNPSRGLESAEVSP